MRTCLAAHITAAAPRPPICLPPAAAGVEVQASGYGFDCATDTTPSLHCWIKLGVLVLVESVSFLFFSLIRLSLHMARVCFTRSCAVVVARRALCSRGSESVLRGVIWRLVGWHKVQNDHGAPHCPASRPRSVTHCYIHNTESENAALAAPKSVLAVIDRVVFSAFRSPDCFRHRSIYFNLESVDIPS